MARRPLLLLPTPVEVRVTAEPSDDVRLGSPRQFVHRGRVHRLAFAVGPERIEGEWWRGHRRTRDYYEVEDDAGLRFWLFRVVRVTKSPDGDVRASARWFIHGRFA
jgi:protein ImuB